MIVQEEQFLIKKFVTKGKQERYLTFLSKNKTRNKFTDELCHFKDFNWKLFREIPGTENEMQAIAFKVKSNKNISRQEKKMDRENLEKYYQSVLPMTLDTVKQLTNKSEFIGIPKNTLLLKENTISKKSYFLESGFIRSYTFATNGDEVTTNIFSAPCIVNDFLSFFKQQPANENFQTLTDCKLWWMSYQDVQTYFHTIPEFREFGRLLLVNNYSLLHERMIGMIKDTAETRYLKLMKTHPDIFQNVPLKIIASYLGITDTSLSRIRKELSQK